ncbi:MAG: sodium/solute symporter [Phycisphaerales bacterium]|nr:MAG: sodium/solute symporter [Phycisphaerales bacterium]
MELGFLDIGVFVAFIVAVIATGVLKSRHEKTSEDYFLAGRGLSWWLIGFSLIAANISTEQFIGMSGSAAKWLGLAIASYEWMAAITLVVVGFFFLPRFLKAGIYTIPEFLEYRYNETARSLMALFMVLIYVFVTYAAVVYSGAIVVKTLFGGQSVFGIEVTITSACWAIGLVAAIYVICGGLKACAWADLLQGSALIVGGAIVLVLAMKALGAATAETVPELANVEAGAGALAKFKALNAHKLHMFLPRNDPEIPWTALVIGLWIPNFYYWGLNQYITQRTLGSKSLAEGQKGIVFAAGLKLIIPFIIVFPGIIAFNLYSSDMKKEAIDNNAKAMAQFEQVRANPSGAKVAFKFDRQFHKMYKETAEAMVAFNAAVASTEPPEAKTLFETNEELLEVIAANNKKLAKDERVKIQDTLLGYKFDSAFALLIKNLVPVGLRGFMLAAIMGAVMSSLASMLNSASTIFTMDLYRKYVNKAASQKSLVAVGRLCVGLFAVIGCFIAPLLDNPKFGGIFKYIQEFQGYISPGILAVFVFGFVVRKAPPITGVVGLLLNPIVYFILAKVLPKMAFLDRMALAFFCVLGVMTVITLIRPLKEGVKFPVKTDIDLEPSKGAKVFGLAVVAVTVMLYIVFR